MLASLRSPKDPFRRDRKNQFALMIFVAAPLAAYLVWDLSQQGKFIFKEPWALLMLLAAPLAYLVLLTFGQRRKATLQYSNTDLLSRLKPGFISRIVSLPAVLRVIALMLIVFALARPQTRDRASRVEVEGIDIVITLDLSKSMEANDLVPNRLEAAKKVVDDFISRRQSDKMGLVVFGREAYTQCPLTLDYSVLRNMLSELRLGLIDGSGTAIGNALGVSLARLRKSDAKSRVIILLTDGDSNSGNVTPEQAARYAQAMKVKVFTILMGPSDSSVLRRDPFGGILRSGPQYPVNPKLLEQIAAQTGGKAYLATDRDALEQNFEKILDELDKSSRKDVAAVFEDAYRPFAAFGLALLLLEIGLLLTRFRHFP